MGEWISKKHSAGHEVFSGIGRALTNSCWEKAITKPPSKSASLFSEPSARKAKALLHFPAHCWRMGDLTLAWARDRWVTHEEKLNGREMAAGFPELESSTETGSSGNPSRRNQSGHQRALWAPQLQRRFQRPLLQRLGWMVERSSLPWLELRSSSDSQRRFGKWKKEGQV